ncbi:Zinc finger CCCH domain-containing protein 3 [Liparis tanakae]|uniref:Zinc finger CCCH domain-containing protein 3 n=1 Tax=Liparis tanakae TaxID=230148 RepID=A0A4Z2HG42_9TELE|nr:Zinc finger CCCH domain-containing protein 3 [Liparis tanakae]
MPPVEWKGGCRVGQDAAPGAGHAGAEDKRVEVESPASSPHRGPASPRVFRTRYKMVTRPGSSPAHSPHYNPALSWRAKRIQSARSFLQSRMRAPHDRHPASAQHWRGSSMCWIRGSLFRVSANKLSRTVASSMSINRTGHVHESCSQRALQSSASSQRSLAIIRQAHQKKQQKQYCMYYNRFGKCNRGDSCPYIHDPDKVAVCTRFLRGTCKQADGTCPFSHKVAKEKMPVCSYFLKGICNNSDCPYSHVYVSRKAEVCEDFVKGYCPEGEKVPRQHTQEITGTLSLRENIRRRHLYIKPLQIKSGPEYRRLFTKDQHRPRSDQGSWTLCKKKHTLVCPDFSQTGSCPRAARCKLQHRQRAKRGAAAPVKRGRTKEPAESSPDEADPPETPPAESSQRKSCRSSLGCETTESGRPGGVEHPAMISVLQVCPDRCICVSSL